MRALLGIGVVALLACTDPPKTAVSAQKKAVESADAKGGETTPAPAADAVAESAGGPQADAQAGALPEPPTADAAAANPRSGDSPADLEAVPTEPPVAEAVVPPPVLAETTIAPVAVARPWREVMSPTEPITFLGTRAGVIGRGTDDFYDVDDNGALVARAEIESPPGEMIVGVWPENAWSVQRIVKETGGRAMDTESFFRLMRLRGNRRWVPQAYEGEQRVADKGEDFFVGGKGGILVVGQSLTRVAGRADDPENYDRSGQIIGAFESARGATFTANRVDADDAVFVSRGCAPDDIDCDPVRTKLPHGSRWSFSASVPRAKYSISALGSAAIDGAPPRAYLLSFGGDAWKLETVAGKPSGMWPAKGGGLWILADETLLHRSGAGVWESVALPEGLGSVSVAMRKDASELWVSGTREGKAFVYAVAGTPEPPAAAG